MNTMISLKELFEHYRLEGHEKHQFKTEIMHPFHRIRYAITRQLIHKYVKGLVLDIGCAEGWFALWMPHGAEYVGIDISAPKIKRAIREVKEKIKIAEFIVCSFDNLPFREETFDTIIWTEGPEHAINPEHVFRELKGLLRDNGTIIVSTMGLTPLLGTKFYDKH
jgi:2-polyprenyl-3-methyl-5-hydroxy-6-metoxy-1,4-benzoquinol methylase